MGFPGLLWTLKVMESLGILSEVMEIFHLWGGRVELMEFCFIPRTIKDYQILRLLNSKNLFSKNGTWSYLKKKILWINIFHYLPHIHDRTSLEILPHWSHEKGFSPVCTLWCLIRLFCMEKLFITLITCEWILPSVYSLIIYKSSSFRINLSTLFTWKWFLSSMYSLLLELQRPNSGRPNSGRPNSGHPNSGCPNNQKIHCLRRIINISILFTWKWFLPSMYSLMSYKTILYGKTLHHIDYM